MKFEQLLKTLKGSPYLAPHSPRQDVIDDNIKMLMEKNQQGPRQEGAFQEILNNASSKPYAQEDEDRLNGILNETKLLETQGQEDPTNTLHNMAKSSLHGGERAFGSYGLMPETIRTMARREKRDNEMGPGLYGLQNASEEDIHKFLQDNEDLQREIAKKYLKDLIGRNPALTDEQVHYRYKMGPSAPISPEKVESDERIKRLKDLLTTKPQLP